MPRKTASTLLLLAVACVWHLTQTSAQNVTPLQQGEPIERTISSGESHLYSLRLEQDQFLQLVVEQHGIDVVVRTSAPDGRRLGEYDNSGGTKGVTIIARDPGLYQVEVAPLGPPSMAASGRYEIRILDIRAATKDELASVNSRETARTKGIALLNETAATLQQIRSANTRTRAQIHAARLLWQIDQKRARKLIDDATISFNEYVNGIAPDEPDTYQNFQTATRLRSQSIQALAEIDAEMALNFLRATRILTDPTARPADAGNQTSALEVSLAALVAAKNPKRALEIAEENLQKGYPRSLMDAMYQLQSSAPDSAAKLADDLAAKLMGENLLKNQEAAGLMLNFLRLAELPASSDSGNSRSPLLSDSQYRDLFNKAVAAALSYAGTPPNSYSIERSNAMYLANMLRSMTAQMDKYAPGKMAALAKMASEYAPQPSQDTRMMQQYQDKVASAPSVNQALDAIGQMPEEVREQFYDQAASKAAEKGDVGLARQIVNDHTSTPAQRQQMMRAIDQQAIEAAFRNGNLAAAVEIANHQHSPKERAMWLLQIAQRMGPSQKHEVVLGLVEQARGLVGGSGRAEDQDQMNVLIQIAMTYIRLEPKRSIDVIDPLIDQFNELVSAAAVMNGFRDKYMENSELIMENGSSLSTIAEQLSALLARLSVRDFDHAKGLADKIQRPEVRISVYLNMAEHTVLNLATDVPGAGSFSSEDQ